mmetsp:Transcript_29833/g.44032  ORF Transcript_29833/g.44032 Transcript_29833/m.44032 type:complete len:335 (-) Transcript_29833:187-1191(-)|eukprot:CAMPEP_0194046764 /NCGR_PEP_ID=MMETSP0009_2-20130614/22287_1 /TAXON_ID=210454 /ORGANISM="Grammatophora oceanica, Strain CCMP 410" /LENGTH=334 /DNA_ID=CAMNT_0038692173 /DNA_START=140 /DNA_END=1144 /DNA_ORIENTATION=+
MKLLWLLQSLFLFALANFVQGEDSCSPAEGTCKVYIVPGAPTEFTESTTGVKLAVRRWEPKDEIKSVLLFIHGGVGWHSAYSENMGKSMAEAGIAVVAYDTVGSGYSEGIDGLRQYFDSVETLTNDISMMLKKLRKDYPDKKVFAMGESFGGFQLEAQILIEQNATEGTLADGYIFTGPVIKLLPEMLPPKIVLTIMGFVGKFFPMLSMPSTDFLSTFDEAFGDPAWAQTGRNDPLVLEAAGIPPRLGMIGSVLSHMTADFERLEEINVPFMMYVGEKEIRVDVDAIKAFEKRASSSDKGIEIVPGARHQLFQDLPEVTERLTKRIQDWILARS